MCILTCIHIYIHTYIYMYTYIYNYLYVQIHARPHNAHTQICRLVDLPEPLLTFGLYASFVAAFRSENTKDSMIEVLCMCMYVCMCLYMCVCVCACV